LKKFFATLLAGAISEVVSFGDFNMSPARHAPSLPVAKVGFAKELGLMR
jgi:hypothetical protein